MPSPGSRFPGRDMLFSLFLLQLLLVPPLLIVPNLTTLVSLHLYDTLPGSWRPISPRPSACS